MEADEEAPRQSKHKTGYFKSEEDVINQVREMTGTGDARNPISFLVEASDDMVYAVVDIEDGIKKGVVSWNEVRTILAEHKSAIGEAFFSSTVELSEKRINSATVPLVGRSKDEAISQYFRTLVIGKARDAVQRAFVSKYGEIMAGAYDKEILYDSDAAGLYNTLKKHIGRKHVYNAKETLRLELLGRKVIQDLLNLFWESVESKKTKGFSEKIYNLLSQNYRTVFTQPNPYEASLPREYRRAQLITDYICGMTDSFALNLHRELFNG